MKVIRRNKAFVVKRKAQPVSVKRKQEKDMVIFLHKGKKRKGNIWLKKPFMGGDYVIKTVKNTFCVVEEKNIVCRL